MNYKQKNHNLNVFWHLSSDIYKFNRMKNRPYDVTNDFYSQGYGFGITLRCVTLWHLYCIKYVSIEKSYQRIFFNFSVEINSYVTENWRSS